MTKRTIGRGGEDSELSLLALLEQLQSDRAAGLYRDLTAYCAANPELSDAFLELARTAEWEEYEEITEITEIIGAPGGDTSESPPLSPGVRRALASIPEFSPMLADSTDATSTALQRRRVAENRSSYRARRPR
jgi:hypothetical protein